MTAPRPFNLMIAHAGYSPWATGLARSLAGLPLRLHWPRTADEAIGLAATRGMHVAVVDDELPEAGGRDTVRGIRLLGLELPCLLVCKGADQRMLQDAIQLDVYSVIEADGDRDAVTPILLKLVRQRFDLDWSIPPGAN